MEAGWSWRGWDLRQLCMMDDGEAALALDALREWVDVPPAGGPTDAVRTLRVADDLLAVPPDRRDSAFAALSGWSGMVREAVADPHAAAEQIVGGTLGRAAAFVAGIIGAKVDARSLMKDGVQWKDDDDYNRANLSGRISVLDKEAASFAGAMEYRRPGR